jgi:hypothetical protein
VPASHTTRRSGFAANVAKLSRASPAFGKTDVRYSANTIDEMHKLLFGYRDNMRVEIGTGVAITAKTVADLRALQTWPNGLVLNIHIDLDPRLSVVRVERACFGTCKIKITRSAANSPRMKCGNRV